MATNHFERREVASQTIYEQQFFVVCGPLPETHSKLLALRKFVWEHFLILSIVASFVLFLLGNWWAMIDYPGAAILYTWRCEILAGGLSVFTIYLYRTFRRWDRERVSQVAARIERKVEMNALLCTPPPLPDSFSEAEQAEEEFAITIEYWASSEPMCLSEECLKLGILPDEFIAPDALVLNFEVKQTV